MIEYAEWTEIASLGLDHILDTTPLGMYDIDYSVYIDWINKQKKKPSVFKAVWQDFNMLTPIVYDFLISDLQSSLFFSEDLFFYKKHLPFKTCFNIINYNLPIISSLYLEDYIYYSPNWYIYYSRLSFLNQRMSFAHLSKVTHYFECYFSIHENLTSYLNMLTIYGPPEPENALILKQYDRHLRPRQLAKEINRIISIGEPLWNFGLFTVESDYYPHDMEIGWRTHNWYPTWIVNTWYYNHLYLRKCFLGEDTQPELAHTRFFGLLNMDRLEWGAFNDMYFFNKNPLEPQANKVSRLFFWSVWNSPLTGFPYYTTFDNINRTINFEDLAWNVVNPYNDLSILNRPMQFKQTGITEAHNFFRRIYRYRIIEEYNHVPKHSYISKYHKNHFVNASVFNTWYGPLENFRNNSWWVINRVNSEIYTDLWTWMIRYYPALKSTYFYLYICRPIFWFISNYDFDFYFKEYLGEYSDIYAKMQLEYSKELIWMLYGIFWFYFIKAFHWAFVSVVFEYKMVKPNFKKHLKFWREWYLTSDFINIRIRLFFNDEYSSYFAHHMHIIWGRSRYLKTLLGFNPINKKDKEILNKKDVLKHPYFFNKWLQLPYDYTFDINFHLVLGAVLLKMRLFYLCFWGALQLIYISLLRFLIINFEMCYLLNFFHFCILYFKYKLSFYMQGSLMYDLWKLFIYFQNRLIVYLFLPAHYRLLSNFIRIFKPLTFYLYNYKTYKSLPNYQPDWMVSLFIELRSISIFNFIGYFSILSLRFIYILIWLCLNICLMSFVVLFKISYFMLNRLFFWGNYLNFRYFIYYLNSIFAYFGLLSEIKYLGNILWFLLINSLIYFFNLFCIVLLLFLFFNLYLYYLVNYILRNKSFFVITVLEYVFFCMGFFVYYFLHLLAIILQCIISFIFYLLMNIQYVGFFFIMWYIGLDWYNLCMLTYHWYIVVPAELFIDWIDNGDYIDMIKNHYSLYAGFLYYEGYYLELALQLIHKMAKMHAIVNNFYCKLIRLDLGYSNSKIGYKVLDDIAYFFTVYSEYSRGLAYIIGDDYTELLTRRDTFKRLCIIFIRELYTYYTQIYFLDTPFFFYCIWFFINRIVIF